MADRPWRRPTPENIERARRAAQVLELRAAGWTYQQIGDYVGMTKAGAMRAVERELSHLTYPNARTIRDLELERLDRLQRAVDTIAIGDVDTTLREDETEGDAEKRVTAAVNTKLKAVDSMIRIMERRAKLLGLDETERRALEDARKQLSAEQGALVHAALSRIFNALDLTPEQRAALPTVVPRELSRVAEEAQREEDDDVLEGEVVPEQEGPEPGV